MYLHQQHALFKRSTSIAYELIGFINMVYNLFKQGVTNKCSMFFPKSSLCHLLAYNYLSEIHSMSSAVYALSSKNEK